MQSGALHVLPCTPPLLSCVLRGHSFRWRIDNWGSFQQDAANRTYGAAFGAGGFSWRLLLFPRGNTVPFLSLYLAVTSDFQTRLPACWVKFARFALIVPNRTAPALVKMTQHQFDRHARLLRAWHWASCMRAISKHVELTSCALRSRENDWGFTQLLELADLADPAKGWIGEDGSLTVEVLVLPSLWAVRRARACLLLLPAACDARRHAADQAVCNAELDRRRGHRR